MKSKNLYLIILITMGLFFSGCGNKGDLYLPEKNDETSKEVKTNP